MVAVGKVYGQFGHVGWVFTCLGSRPLVTRDRHGATKRIRVGGLRAGIRADSPPHTVMFLH